MSHWKCSNCGYRLEAEAPPERCPECRQACAFHDITCYIPECGGEDNVDPRVA
jgi:rubredoxin